MKYKEIDNESTDMAAEPVATAYNPSMVWAQAPADPIDENDDDEDNPWLQSDADPGVGPYTMEELHARIDEAEESSRLGLGKSWSQVKAELKKDFSWLR